MIIKKEEKLGQKRILGNSILKERIIALGVSGGIACYKAVDLASRLTKAGAKVKVVMTKNAAHFVTPLSFQTITRQTVLTDLFTDDGNKEIYHVSVGEEADVFVVAPATANILAKAAHGIADDALSTTILAARSTVIMAPSMNNYMWLNPATQHNIEILKERGIHMVGPEIGRLACGEENAIGRLAGVDLVIAEIERVLYKKTDLNGLTIMITAGGTREPIDPVRFIGNRSSGKMGYAIADAAVARGADVILITGPSCLSAPNGAEIIRIETAQQMHNAVTENLNRVNAVIMSAAVADIKPVKISGEKTKKDLMPRNIELEINPDILQTVALKRDEMGDGKNIIVGFAAESERVIENAMEKLKRKGLDIIVANDISVAGAGFDSDMNLAAIIDREGLFGKSVDELRMYKKIDLAERILDRVKQALS